MQFAIQKLLRAVSVLFLFAAVFDSPSVQAQAFGGSNGLFLGAGFFNHNAGIAASDASSGAKPFFGEVYTHLELAGKFVVSDEWFLYPHLIYGFPGKESPEGKETSTVVTLGLRSHRVMYEGFDLHLGPGILYYQIKGNGGIVPLSNGSGTTNFGIPSTTKTSTLIYFDFGGGYQMEQYRFDISLLMTGAFSTPKRALNAVFTFSMEVL